MHSVKKSTGFAVKAVGLYNNNNNNNNNNNSTFEGEVYKISHCYQNRSYNLQKSHTKVSCYVSNIRKYHVSYYSLQAQRS